VCFGRFIILTVTLWLSGALHAYLHVGCYLCLQAILPALGNLLCGWLHWEQMFLMPLVREKLWKWLHKTDASCSANQGRLVLRNSISAVPLWAVETWPVENKRSFHLIRLLPCDILINYSKKLFEWNIRSRWPWTPLWKKKWNHPTCCWVFFFCIYVIIHVSVSYLWYTFIANTSGVPTGWCI